MSKYTTGEMAKMAGVSVRTVQYYDTRGILSPSALSEGGRRLYSDEDLQKLKIICYLRDMGMPINSINALFDEETPEDVISMLLNQQEDELKHEISAQQEKLGNLGRLKRELKNMTEIGAVSIETIGDAMHKINNRKNLRRTRIVMITFGLLADFLEWGTILYWIFTGNWRPFVFCLPVIIGLCVWVTKYYFARVAYICPECHTEFVPRMKESLLAKHTPTLRKVTCTHCGRKGFCVEVHRSETE